MNNTNFAILKIECCNNEKNSPCRLIVAGVNEQEMAEPVEFLIKPIKEEFEYLTSGMSYEELADKKPFEEQWDEIHKQLSTYNIIISTSDGYDADVLQKSIDRYELKSSSLSYITAKNICRKTYSDYSYSITSISEKLKIDNANGNDPIRAANFWVTVVLKCMKFNADESLKEFCDRTGIIWGSIEAGNKKSSFLKRDYSKRTKTTIEVDPSKFDKQNPFFDQIVVFTGTMKSFSREEAREEILKIGGRSPKDVSKSTNYLVSGTQTEKVGISEKQNKAIRFKDQGFNIELLSEEDFIEMAGLQHIVEFKNFIEDFFSLKKPQ